MMKLSFCLANEFGMTVLYRNRQYFDRRVNLIITAEREAASVRRWEDDQRLSVRTNVNRGEAGLHR